MGTKHDEYNATLRGRYRHIKYKAKKKALPCLSYNEYLKVADANCWYCNVPRELAEPTASWLDQLLPGKGYAFRNVRPCCGSCNKIKGDTLSEYETLAVARFIYELRAKKGSNKKRKIRYEPLKPKTYKARIRQARRDI